MYQLKAKQLIVDYVNSKDNLEKPITEDDVYIVWSCKALGCYKILLSTSIPDGMYYEVTIDDDNNKLTVIRMGVI